MTEDLIVVGPFVLTWADLRAVQAMYPTPRHERVLLWFFHLCAMMGFMVIFGVLGASVLTLLGSPPGAHGSAGFFAASIFGGGVCYALFLSLVYEPLTLRRTLRLRRLDEDQLRVSISPLRVEYHRRQTVIAIPWSEVAGVSANRNYVFLMVPAAASIPIPARAFESIETMRRFVSAAQGWHSQHQNEGV